MNDIQQTSSTSTLATLTTPDALPALPAHVVERIFARLIATYGMGGVHDDGDPAFKMTVWAQGLSGFSMEELQRGVLATPGRFAPSLAEFRLLCRPGLDAETAWCEALDGIGTFNTYAWSHRAVRDTAQDFAHELYSGQPFAKVRKRFEHALRGHWEIDRARTTASSRLAIAEGPQP